MTSHFSSGFHTMGGDEAMDKFEICMGANLTCMNDLMNRMGRQWLTVTWLMIVVLRRV